MNRASKRRVRQLGDKMLRDPDTDPEVKRRIEKYREYDRYTAEEAIRRAKKRNRSK